MGPSDISLLADAPYAKWLGCLLFRFAAHRAPRESLFQLNYPGLRREWVACLAETGLAERDY
eukprot:11320678-Alexandrium_andersonii.AAC.1